MKPEALCEPAGLEALARLAESVDPDLAIVELGVHQASSTVTMAEVANAHIWGFDPWGQIKGIYQGRPHMLKRYTSSDEEIARAHVKDSGVSDKVTLVKATGVDGASRWDNGPVGMLFIDAEHTQPSVERDFLAWIDHLADDAWVVFDDHCRQFPGVVSAVSNFVKNDLVEFHRLYGTRLWVGKKTN